MKTLFNSRKNEIQGSLISFPPRVRLALLLPILPFLLLAAVAQATDVNFSFRDFQGSSQDFAATNIVLEVKELSAITVNGTNIVYRTARRFTNSVTGTLLITNMEAGVYSCKITPKTDLNDFQITVTNSATALDAASLITTSTNVVGAGGQAYSIASANARFVAKNGSPTNGQGLTYDAATGLFWPSNAASSAVQLGQILLVDKANGSDATGTRGRLDKPFQTILAAVTNGQAGDTVWALPNVYDNGTNNILRRGLNYNLVGSYLSWSNGSSSANIYGLFDDRLTGATTNYFYGGRYFGTAWRSDVDEPNINLRGLFVITNAASTYHFVGVQKVENTMPWQGQLGGFYWGIYQLNGLVFWDVDHMTDPYSPPDAFHASRAGGIYWEGGEFHGRVRLCDYQAYYGLWGHAADSNSVASFWYDGDTLTVGANAAFYQDIIAANDNASNFKSWLNIKEIRSTNGIGVSVVGMHKSYVKAEKISGNTAVASSGQLWLDAQKVTSSGTLLALSGGTNDINIAEYEDTGTSGNPVILSGGVNRINGGRYKSGTSSPGWLLSGGTNFLDDLSIDMTPSAATNAYPLIIGGVTNTTLKNLDLYAPGSLAAIFAYSNRVLKVLGVINVTNSISTNLDWSGGIIMSNGYVLNSVNETPYVEDPEQMITRVMINGGAAANLTALGDSATISASGSSLLELPTATNGAGVLIAAGNAGSFAVSSVNGNLIYRMGRKCNAWIKTSTCTNTSTVIWWFGFSDQTAAVMTTNNPAGNYAAFRYSTTGVDSTYKCITKDGSTQTITDSLVTADRSTHTFRVKCMDAQSKVVFFIDGRSVATNSANLPVSGTMMRYFESIQSLASQTNAFKVEEIVLKSL